MRKLCCVLFALLLPTVALAKPVQVAPPAPFDVPTEVITTGNAKNKPGIFWDGFTIGNYIYYNKLTSEGNLKSIFSSTVKYVIKVEYRFMSDATTERHKGLCSIDSQKRESAFGFVIQAKSSDLYACSFEGSSATDYALEASVVPFGEISVGTSTFSVASDYDTNDAKYARTIIRMTYEDATYEAIPTTYDPDRTISRMIDGYVIYRDQKQVGRVDFQGNNRNKATITAPVAAEDGREAVIFMAAQLVAMPDLNAGFMRGLLGID